MIICSQCLNAFYRRNKRRRSSNTGPVFEDDSLKGYAEEENEELQQSISFDNLLLLDDIYGNSDDCIYCVFCMKSGVEMMLLSLSERMTLLCNHKLYTSSNACRRTSSCYDTLRRRLQERTQLSTKQAAELVHDPTTELSRVGSIPLLTDNSIAFSDDDYLSWTFQQRKRMTSIVEPRTNSSKHRTLFEAICQFRIKVKAKLSCRRIGILFKISTSEESIGGRIATPFMRS